MWSRTPLSYRKRFLDLLVRNYESDFMRLGLIVQLLFITVTVQKFSTISQVIPSCMSMSCFDGMVWPGLVVGQWCEIWPSCLHLDSCTDLYGAFSASQFL
jgi:hypothetical protein